MCALALPGRSFAADPLEAHVTSVASADSLERLKQAGASITDLAKFENKLNQMWPEDRLQLESDLRRQSAADIAGYVARLRVPSLDDQYVPGADYAPQTGVPEGKTFEFALDHSSIYPGTTRNIRVYVPAAYSATTPACVYVSLDDLFFQAPRALDNLIHRHEIPVIIAIGVRPGVVDSSIPNTNPRFDRSFEFDALSGRLAQFLLQEVLPAVEQHKTPDGLPIRLSRDPNDRAVGGISTGGIGAFTLAWERPDTFSRVFIGIGTFVGMRGGDRYPGLVRKTEPKPIRIFMQDGSHDELTSVFGEIGDWWLGNQTMQSALEFAGYEVQHVWGEGTHSARHALVAFPDAMRWLWKDWPRPIRAGVSQNTFLRQILLQDESWQTVEGSYRTVSALATDREGDVMFWDGVGATAWKISDAGRVSQWPRFNKPYAGMAFGPDGRAYVTRPAEHKVVAYAADGRSSTVASGIRGANLLITHSGLVYLTEPGGRHARDGRIWLIDSHGDKHELDSQLDHPTGIALSPDGQWLAVSENNTHWGYSYRVRSDGFVDGKERFYWFHVSDESDDSGAGPWAMDREGRLYAATRMGIQVFDRNGRVRAILPVPGGEVTTLTFGGAQFNVLYVGCTNNKVYRRVIKTMGAPSWAPPIKLPSGAAG
jgi:gluconolactonase